jgi:hypothetical protein
VRFYHLTTLEASTAYYVDSFNFYMYMMLVRHRKHIRTSADCYGDRFTYTVQFPDKILFPFNGETIFVFNTKERQIFQNVTTRAGILPLISERSMITTYPRLPHIETVCMVVDIFETKSLISTDKMMSETEACGRRYVCKTL